MDKQAREARQMAREMPLQDRLKHYWEYYKAYIVAITISVVLILISVISSVVAPKYDIEVAYYGTYAITAEQEVALEEYLATLVEDINGDGECKVDLLVSRSSLSQEENENEYQMALVQKFQTEVATGAYPAFILDKPHLDYAGMADEREDGIIESVKDMRNNPQLAELLGDNEIYWCTRILYDKEIGKEEPEALHQNAVRIENTL